MKIAASGIDKLRDAADFTIVLDNNRLTRMEGARDLPMSEAMKVIERSVAKIVEAVSAQTSSYVNTLMQDITGCVDALDEPVVMPPSEQLEERMIHAELTPTFDGFGPNMFG
jgi:cell division GTPase FtsZ